MTTKFRGRTKRAARQGKEQIRQEMLCGVSQPMRRALNEVARMGDAEMERRVAVAAREMAELSRPPVVH